MISLLACPVITPVLTASFTTPEKLFKSGISKSRCQFADVSGGHDRGLTADGRTT